MRLETDGLGRFKQIERDLSGMKINKLTAIKRIKLHKGKEKSLRWYWECLCDCGKITNILEYSFYSGRTKSCGCAIKGVNAKPFKVASANVHFNRYKLSAHTRNIEFLLSREEFDYLTSQLCYYCGALPIEKVFQKSINGHIVANGIDRIDSNKNYSLENCVPSCSNCNMAKKELSIIDFFSLVKKIYIHSKLDQI